MTIRGQALYVGVRLEAGQTFGDLAGAVVPGFNVNEMIYGRSLYLTGRTQAGPLTVGVGHHHRLVEPLDRGRQASR